MPAVVTCPKCKTKYKLPDEMLGKAIKCKSCETAFRTKAPAGATAVSKPQTPARSAHSAAELAQLGIDGPLRRQPDLFANAVPLQAPDILGNHAADPGFAETVYDAQPEDGPAPTANDPSEMFPNPAIRSSKKSNTEEVDDGKTVKKKRKKKMHPAVKDSLDKASMAMFFIGAFTCVFSGFMLYNFSDDAAFAADSDVTSFLKIFFIMGIGIGVVFCILGVGVQFFPVTCTIMSLVLFLAFEGFGLLINPFSIMSFTAWIRRIVIGGALGKAMMDAMNARSFEKAQELRMARKRETRRR